MKIEIRNFSGEIPRLDDHVLPQNASALTDDATFRRGVLEPFRFKSSEVHRFSTPCKSIYLHKAEWLGWDHDTDVVPGPVADDRLYITHENGPPTIRVQGEELPLALPTPSAAPGVSLVGSSAADANTGEYIAYAFTWVTSLGEESAPSPLSRPILWSEGRKVSLSNLPGTPPVNRRISGKRIYRVITSAGGASELYFVDEIGASDVSYIHDIASKPAAEAIRTKEFGPPPDDLRGLTALPNGIMAGFRGKELWFCEPYQPHAWPTAYVLTTNDFIVGLAAFGTSLAVLTTGMPYVVQGLHPDQMVMAKLEQPFPCLSKAGIVDMGYSAIYPSTDGLVMVSAEGAQLISAHLWTTEQWRELVPTTIIAGRYQSQYAFSHLTDEQKRSSLTLVEPLAENGTISRYDDIGAGIYTHLESGNTYLLSEDGLSLAYIDAPERAYKTYRWRSKKIRLSDPVSFSVIKVDSEWDIDEKFTGYVYADGRNIHRFYKTGVFVRLPGGKKYRTWQIRLYGTAIIHSVTIAESLAEMSQ